MLLYICLYNYEQIEMNARRAIFASTCALTTRARSAAPVDLDISSSVMAKDVKVYNIYTI